MRRGESPPEEKILRTYRAAAVMATIGIAVKLTTTAGYEGYVSIAGDGERAIGILETAAVAVGDEVRVCVHGFTMAVANHDFAINDLLNSGASTGKLDTAATTEQAIAVAEQAATAQNDKVAVFVHSQYAV